MNKAIVPRFAALAMLAVLPVQADAQCTITPVFVHITPNSLIVKPAAPKCVEYGSDPAFIIHVTPTGAAQRGAITVTGKEGESATISGNNAANPDNVEVKVENGVPGNLYRYNIVVEGHGMLDPEVRVVESRAFMRTQIDEADALLQEELGISLQEASDTLRELNATENKSEGQAE